MGLSAQLTPAHKNPIEENETTRPALQLLMLKPSWTDTQCPEAPGAQVQTWSTGSSARILMPDQNCIDT